MKKQQKEKLEALIFLDTNILLDFYRIRKSNVSLKYLEEIEAHKDLIITTSQIEMEFKKNRQRVILESIGEVNKISSFNLSFPAILADAKATAMIKRHKKEIEMQQKKLKQQIERILKDPSRYDPVYKSLQKLWKTENEINLNRENKIRYTIRRLAIKRFMLGYPPRKKDDNSIGDAVNWEWIIKCAETTGKHIILVTRDQDFGTIYQDESYLDDWLSQEFKQRISRKRKLILTDKLHKAFQLVEIPVTEEMIEEEEKVIRYSFDNYQLKELQKRLSNIQTSFISPELQETMVKISNSYDLSGLQEKLRSLNFNLDDLGENE